MYWLKAHHKQNNYLVKVPIVPNDLTYHLQYQQYFFETVEEFLRNGADHAMQSLALYNLGLGTVD